MENKMLKKVSTVTAAGMMMTAMLGMQVSAAENEGTKTTEIPKHVTITKNITKESNVYAPNTTFKFTIAPGTAVPAGQGTQAVYAGPAGGATLEEGMIVSTPKDSDIGVDLITAGTTSIKINESVFTTGANAKPGIFRYVVSEIATDKDGNVYEGIDYTTEQKYFDVYVTSDDNGNLEVSSYTFVKTGSVKEKDDGTFTNNYSKDHDKLKDLTVKKEVTGNQGDHNKNFEFTLKVDGAAGEKYYVTFSDSRPAMTLVSGTAKTITLKDDQTAKIWGLSDSDKYTITEASYESDGYETSIDSTKTSTTTGTMKEGAGETDNKGDRKITVVNDKNATTPTGIFLHVTPYLALIGAALLSGILFFRRKHVKDLDID